MRTRLVLLAVVACASLVLGACSSSDDHDDMEGMEQVEGTDTVGDSDDPASTTTLDIPDDAEFNATDVAFSRGMIPHHGQAVQMADLALDVSSNPDIVELAEQIQAAQGPEIEQMAGWLTDWDQSVPDPDAMVHGDMDGAGGMMMSGMMSGADMERLAGATGSDFDRMFLEMMIVHHEGAIEMAEQLLADGRYQATQDLAEAVIAGQQAEIEAMEALLADLPS